MTNATGITEKGTAIGIWREDEVLLCRLNRVSDPEPGDEPETGESQDLQPHHDGLLGGRPELVSEAFQSDETCALVSDRAAQEGDGNQQVPAYFLGPPQ